MIVNGSVLLSSPPGGGYGVDVGAGQAAPIAREPKRPTRMADKTEVLIFDTLLLKRVKIIVNE